MKTLIATVARYFLPSMPVTRAIRCVVALPPSGLMGAYLRAIRKTTGTTVALNDTPENIVERITFCDIDSKPIEKCLTPDEKRLYIKEIKKDMTYFRKTYDRADIQISITGLDADEAAKKIKNAVKTPEGASHGSST